MKIWCDECARCKVYLSNMGHVYAYVYQILWLFVQTLLRHFTQNHQTQGNNRDYDWSFRNYYWMFNILSQFNQKWKSDDQQKRYDSSYLPLVDMCTKFHCNSPNSWWDTSVWTKVVNRLTNVAIPGQEINWTQETSAYYCCRGMMSKKRGKQLRNPWWWNHCLAQRVAALIQTSDQPCPTAERRARDVWLSLGDADARRQPHCNMRSKWKAFFTLPESCFGKINLKI